MSIDLTHSDPETSHPERLECPDCGAPMNITHRASHPIVLQGEEQTLSCMACKRELSRVVNKDGDEV
jgi:hypothetical protein